MGSGSKKKLTLSTRRKSRKRLGRENQLKRLYKKMIAAKSLQSSSTTETTKPTLQQNEDNIEKLQKQQATQAPTCDIQKQETSGTSFDVKQEITIDECVLEECKFPKLETGVTDEKELLSEVEIPTLQEVKLELGFITEENASLILSTASTSHNKRSDENSQVEKDDFLNIIPKLEVVENTNNDIVQDEEKFIFPNFQNQPLPETILRSTLKDNINFSSSNTNSASHCKKRIVSDIDAIVEDRDFLNIIDLKSKNKDDLLNYAMRIAIRLENANQSDRAIEIAKQKIEHILCDLETGIFENSFY